MAVGLLRRAWETIVYWVRLFLLGVFGPATLDDEHDPIVLLKRQRQQRLRARGAPAKRRPAWHRPHDGQIGGEHA